MAEVQRSPQAEADLEAILEELDRKNPAVAERYTTLFEERIQLLAKFPEMGRARPEIARHVRSVLADPYVLFYRVQGDMVQVLRILHGKMDLSKIMRNKSDKSK